MYTVYIVAYTWKKEESGDIIQKMLTKIVLVQKDIKSGWAKWFRSSDFSEKKRKNPTNKK